MKNTFILILSSALAFVACSNDVEEWNGGNGGSTTPTKPVVVTGSEWAALADSCTYVLVESFMDKTTGTFWGTPRDMSHNSQYLYWQQSHSIDVVLASYIRIKDSNPELAATYAGYFQKWYDNGAHNYNTSHKDDGDYGRFYNDWTDDMAWICLTLLKFYDEFGVEKFATAAKNVYDNYIWTRATTTDKNYTALPWTNHDEDKTNFNGCTNAPSCLVAAKLYQKYKTSSYLKNAVALYDFSTSKEVMTETGKVEDPYPLTYTQGTFAEAARILYHITGDTKYRDMAGSCLTYTFTSGRCTDSKTGVLRDEGQSDDQALFKAVFVPYCVNYILDESMPAATRQTLKDKLLLCGKHLSKNLDRTMFPQMYCSYTWVEPIGTWSPTMCAQASGASLFEGIARITAE